MSKKFLETIKIVKNKPLQEWEILELQGAIETRPQKDRPIDGKTLGSLALYDKVIFAFS